MLELGRRFIRPLAFLRAEIFEILRQPSLILTLVLAPFLILLLFGISYHNVGRDLRTLFVVPAGDPLEKDVQEFGPNIGPQLIYSGIDHNEADAKAKLARGEVDVVAVAPPHASETVRNNQQAVFTLYHNEIDPIQVDYVQYFGQIYIDAVNRRVLQTMIQKGEDGRNINADPNVLVSPFRVETKSIAVVQPTLASYYAPAVIVLLLQHLAITFGSLSIVRELQLGRMELLRVAPISAGETLFGKYVSYLLFGGVIAAILTGLLVYVLQVPMLGEWAFYALTVFALLFAALGIGFFISLISQTETQAVQYVMIVLLATVFFSGFFLRLDQFTEPVRLISWAFPATTAITLLQNIMLRGYRPDAMLLGPLFGAGVALYAVSLVLLARRMGHR